MITQLPVNFMKESKLIKRAASHQKLTLRGRHNKYSSSLDFDSEFVGKFSLGADFVSALRNRGFSFGPSTDPTRNELIYLSGNSNQRGKELFETDCWSWNKTETDDFWLTIYFRLSADENERGIVCTPHVWGNCSGDACHAPTVNNFVRVVAEHFPDAHQLIKEAARTNFQPIVFWGDINMAGIKSVGRLFYEGYGQNKTATALANSFMSPFTPDPYLRRSIRGDSDRLFVPESEQPRLLRQWKEQLQCFKDSLT